LGRKSGSEFRSLPLLFEVLVPESLLALMRNRWKRYPRYTNAGYWLDSEAYLTHKVA
jgi:hypothetical protein